MCQDDSPTTPPRGGLLTFREIAVRISDLEGRRLSRQAIVLAHKKALRKIRRALKDDPEIADVLAERNLR